jgi:uncharacterized protein YpbB
MCKCQQYLNELFNDALKTSEVILAFEEWYKDIGCQVCKVLSKTFSGKTTKTKTPEQIKLVGFVSRVWWHHVHKMSITANNFYFAKEKWPEKAQKCPI